jgi:hypothetical protein
VHSRRWAPPLDHRSDNNHSSESLDVVGWTGLHCLRIWFHKNSEFLIQFNNYVSTSKENPASSHLEVHRNRKYENYQTNLEYCDTDTRCWATTRQTTFHRQRILRQQSYNFRCYAMGCKYNNRGRGVFYMVGVYPLLGNGCFIWIRLETIYIVQ